MTTHQIEAAANRAFSWNARVCAPLGQTGTLRFRPSDPRLFECKDVLLSRGAANTILHFIGNFCAFSASADMSAYQDALSEALEQSNLPDSGAMPIFAWPIIVTGLQNYGLALGGYLKALPASRDEIIVSISPLHLWALGEAARAFIMCIDPGNVMPGPRSEAAEVLRLTEDENLAVSQRFMPYANIVNEE